MYIKILVTLFLFHAFSFPALAEHRLVIKYRDSSVDVDAPYFEYLNTSKSSWIGGAWYDMQNKYLIITLSKINYHYCDVSSEVWQNFKNSISFGEAYIKLLKGRFDCRLSPAPTY